MHLSTIEPWLIAALFGVLAMLCGHVAGLCGHIADLIDLYCRARPDSAFSRQPRRWREQRWFYWALAVSCATGALCFAAIALGWG